jgi:hypothetical protein
MADQLMRTSVETAAIVPEVWSANFYNVLSANLPWISTVSKDWEGEITDMGSTVRIPSIPEFSAAIEVAEDAKADADSVTITTQSLVINSRIVKDFIVTSKSQLQSIEFINKLRDLAAFSIEKKMQALLISATVPSASAPDHQIAYDSGTTLALADILEAKELLDAANVPMADRHMIVGSAAWNDIFNITGFTSSDYLVSGAPLQTGELPSALLGFQPHFTTEVGTTSYFFHSSYLTCAIQKQLSVSEFDLGVDGIRGKRINTDVLWGYKQLDNKRVVTIA